MNESINQSINQKSQGIHTGDLHPLTGM